MCIMPLSGNVSVHINEFQEAIHYPANANFLLAEHVIVGMLLSFLLCNPNHSDSWDYFAKSIKVDTGTTLARIMSQILEEKHWQIVKNDGDTSKTTLAIQECYT